jgi:hypothetical protein
MSRRNFILLIIVLVILGLSILGYWYFHRGVGTGGDNGGTDGTNFNSGFPNGSNGGNNSGGNGGTTDISGGSEGTVGITGKLEKVSNLPVAGYAVFQKERTKGVFIPALRYADQKTGNIYQTFADTIEEHILTKTLVPKIYDAYFSNSANNVFMRYTKNDEITVETFGGTLPKETLGEPTASTELKSSFLQDDITDLNISPDSSKMFYLLESGDNVSGTVLDPLTNKKAVVFNSPFTEWISQWPNKSLITLTTKASALAPGYMYSVNPDKKDLNKVIGDIAGLTTLTSPTGKLVLYGDSNLNLYIFNTADKTSSSLGIRGMPEKCVWNGGGSTIFCASPSNIASGLYPDTWYQGETSFNDQIFKVDVSSGNSSLILTPSEEINGLQIDGLNLKLDNSETYLFFQNKKDSTLWKLNLK